jgi:hypothetical protein
MEHKSFDTDVYKLCDLTALMIQNRVPYVLNKKQKDSNKILFLEPWCQASAVPYFCLFRMKFN